MSTLLQVLRIATVIFFSGIGVMTVFGSPPTRAYILGYAVISAIMGAVIVLASRNSGPQANGVTPSRDVK